MLRRVFESLWKKLCQYLNVPQKQTGLRAYKFFPSPVATDTEERYTRLVNKQYKRRETLRGYDKSLELLQLI